MIQVQVLPLRKRVLYKLEWGSGLRSCSCGPQGQISRCLPRPVSVPSSGSSKRSGEDGRSPARLQPARRRRRGGGDPRRRRRRRRRQAEAARLQAAAQARPLGGVQLRGDVLDRVGGDGRDDAVRDGPPVRRAGDHGVRVAHRRRLHPRRGARHGRDLLRLPHLRRPLLLERQALRPPAVGALRRLAHRLVTLLPILYLLTTPKDAMCANIFGRYVAHTIACKKIDRLVKLFKRIDRTGSHSLAIR